MTGKTRYTAPSIVIVLVHTKSVLRLFGWLLWTYRYGNVVKYLHFNCCAACSLMIWPELSSQHRWNCHELYNVVYTGRDDTDWLAVRKIIFSRHPDKVLLNIAQNNFVWQLIKFQIILVIFWANQPQCPLLGHRTAANFRHISRKT